MGKRIPQLKDESSTSEDLVCFVEGWYRRLSRDVRGETALLDQIRLTHGALILRTLEARGIARDGQLGRAANDPSSARSVAAVFSEARERFGAVFSVPHDGIDSLPETALSEYISALYSPSTTRLLQAVPIGSIGHAYEQCLATAVTGQRKAGGVYYTPEPIVAALVDQTLGTLLSNDPTVEPLSLRVVDPACGTGAFLLGAYERLLEAQLQYLLSLPTHARRGRVLNDATSPRLSAEERRAVLENCIFGVDLDEHALEIAKLSLFLRMQLGPNPKQLDLFSTPESPALETSLLRGNSLLTPSMQVDESEPSYARAIDWPLDFPAVSPDGFDVVIGNPPWGQKAVDAGDEFKHQIRKEYPSSEGIFDWYRPFVELGVRLTRGGGLWGMVLPDVILLKNYEPTRRLLLTHLALTEIEWLGMAFSGATIDAVTIAGRKQSPPSDHHVHVVVSEPGNELDHHIRQSDFFENPRCVFNLFLTEEKRNVVETLSCMPRLKDFFEVHEGIHSGNIRKELFVEERVDDSCRELLFGRDELRPYSLRWNGRFVKLSAVPERKTKRRYANTGRREWYEQDKLLVRRTGDRITAALEGRRRFASNNFFLVIPRRGHPLSLHGLCALLNSSFMTWWFRTMEPRKGRAFAEVKIKHLNEFPVPSIEQKDCCGSLNKLGEARARADDSQAQELDAQIDQAVLALFGLGENVMGDWDAEALPNRRTA